MKKVLTLLLCILMATLTLTYKVQADDVPPSDDVPPCDITPTSHTIKNNVLMWEADERADGFYLHFDRNHTQDYGQVRTLSNNYYLFDKIEDNDNYTILIKPYSLQEDCSGEGRLVNVIVTKFEGTLEKTDTLSPVGDGGDVDLLNSGLYVDAIEVSYTVKKGYKLTFYNASLPSRADYNSETIQASDDDVSGKIALPAGKFENGNIYYSFEQLPPPHTTYTYDLGVGHEKIAKAIVDYLEQSETKFILDGTKIKFDYRSNLELGLFARQAIQATIYSLKEGFVDNNEMFALVNVSPDASDLKAVMELIMDESKMAKDYDFTLYALWLKYTGSGGGTWTLDDTGSLDFTFTRNLNDKGIPDGLISTFESFDSLQLDGKEITDYTAKEGSLIVTLSDSVLNKLSVGTHTLTATFNPELFIGEDSDTAINSGTLTASVSFTVKEKEEPKPEPKPTPYVLPKTGVE